ncbi:hypothetical protein MZM54_05195 [[Brevibacterium] frigoritolerans]|nr:hypothetical protein [Peribacillus frigoritolerans]
MTVNSDVEVEKMWLELENVTFVQDEDGELVLGSDWGPFHEGADRDETVWRWFDENHSKGLGYLMYELEEEE